MIIFQYRSTTGESECGTAQTGRCSADEIVRRIPECPQNLALAISRLQPQDQERVMSALAKIRNTMGDVSESALQMLGHDGTISLFLSDPERIADYFDRIIKATGNHSSEAFDYLGQGDMAYLFSAHPEEMMELIDITDGHILTLMTAFQDECIADLFESYPERFVELANIIGPTACYAFKEGFSDERVSDLFVRKYDAMAQLADEAGDWAMSAIIALKDKKVAARFEQYANDKVDIDQFMLTLYANKDTATSIGGIIDFLHDRPGERTKALAGIPTEKVLGCLLSDPANFYTSTNHMFFDRLKRDLAKEGKTLPELFDEYQVTPDLILDFILRAINYDRLYGKPDSMLTESDMRSLMGIVIDRINDSKFDASYYFLLANAIGIMIKSGDMPDVVADFKNKIIERYEELANKKQASGLTRAERKIVAALEFLLFEIDTSTQLVSTDKKQRMRDVAEKGTFEPDLYRGPDGKILVVQVFDRQDTEEDHWGLTQRYFSKYGTPKKGERGELVYETPNARVVLFMGENPKANMQFVSDMLGQNPNAIMSFRGHSFSLEYSFPDNIFQNAQHVLFVVGSCGSTGSVVRYMSANPNVDQRFISNSSTGRGMVTNAIIDELIRPREEPVGMTAFMEAIRPRIVAAGGDPYTMKTWEPGEGLLDYVLGQSTR